MNREELLKRLAHMIVSRKKEGRPLMVAIDGRSAAGKSTLAEELGELIRSYNFQALRMSVDGFLRPRESRQSEGEVSAGDYYEHAFNYKEVIDSVLMPISGDTFPVLCRQFSVARRGDLPTCAPSVSASAQSILLFEGVLVFRRELNPYWDFKIFLDVDPAISLARGLARDPLCAEEAIQRRYESWFEPAWRIYVKKENPGSKADVIIDNRDFSHPILLKPTSA